MISKCIRWKETRGRVWHGTSVWDNRNKLVYCIMWILYSINLHGWYDALFLFDAVNLGHFQAQNFLINTGLFFRKCWKKRIPQRLPMFYTPKNTNVLYPKEYQCFIPQRLPMFHTPKITNVLYPKDYQCFIPQRLPMFYTPKILTQKKSVNCCIYTWDKRKLQES